MVNDKITEWMNFFLFYIKLSGMCSQWAYVCEWKESSSHGPTEVLWWRECINHPPEWCMWIVDFSWQIFTLTGCFILPFFVSWRLLKLQPGKLFPVGFILDGLIVKTSIVQSNFLSYVQCSRTSIKVVHHWMIAPANDKEISFLFFSQLTSLK